MARRRFTGPGAPVDGLEPHQAHQPAHPFPVDDVILALQPGSYLACPIEWRHQVLTVNQLHEFQVLLWDSFRLVVQAGPADIQ